jgi:hypothetical protein
LYVFNKQGKKASLPRTKSAEDFNPLLAMEGKWGGQILESLSPLIENYLKFSIQFNII